MALTEAWSGDQAEPATTAASPTPRPSVTTIKPKELLGQMGISL